MTVAFFARLPWLVLVGGLGCVASCGIDVAQTAFRPEIPLDCSTAAALKQPRSGLFGTGGEVASSWAGGGYAAHEGPGLYVTARDAFRVYLNGELVTESEGARTPRFVPLSLAPGKNALSVVVEAVAGTPLALVQLDELSESYVSDADWKVSSSPPSDFTAADFDDSSWPAAHDYGPLGSLPGCDPTAEFPLDSRAHWIGPKSGPAKAVALRLQIDIEPSGYGAGTVGGGVVVPVLIESWGQLATLAGTDEPAVLLLAEGLHDFRTAPRDQDVCETTCTADPAKSQYTVLVPGGTCATALVTQPRDERTLAVGSNKTLVGLGRGAQLRGVTLNLGSSQDVIVRNVTIYDVNSRLVEAGDAFTLGTPSRVWLDHCTMKWISDGFSDVAGGDATTFSWLHYDGVSPTACQGQHPRAAQLGDVTMTVQHCFFDHVLSHAPRASGAKARVHVLNNLISDNLGYGVGSVCGAQVLMEGNYLERVATPTARSTCPDDTTPGLIDAPLRSNVYGADVGAHQGPDGLEPHDAVFKPPYAYVVEGAAEERLTILERAGAGGPWALPLVLD